MTGHREPSKIKPRLSTSCFNTANDRAISLIIEVKEKRPYGLITWVQGLQNNQLGGTDERSSSF